MSGFVLVSTRRLAPLLWAALVGTGCGEGSFYFSYNHHGEDWIEGECASRDRQSPIDFGYNAPWSCEPPVLEFMRHFLGPEYFIKLGFAKLAGDVDGSDMPPVDAAMGSPAAAPAPAGPLAVASPAAAGASFLQVNASAKQLPPPVMPPPDPLLAILTQPTKAPMIIPGCGTLGAFFFKYDPAEKSLTMQNNGHALSTDLKGHGLGSISWDGFVFDVLSVNFHVRSEHTFKDKQYPLELHIVHREPETDHILVVAVPFDVPPSAAASLLQKRSKRKGLRGCGGPGDSPCEPLDPLAEGQAIDPDQMADAAKLSPDEAEQIASVAASGPKEPQPTDLGFSEALANLVSYPLPADGETKSVNLRAGPVDLIGPLISDKVENGVRVPQGFFQYRGSLTAPPCSEQVTWLVRKDPLYASKSQVEVLRVAIMQANSNFENARSTMPLMGRSILYKLAIQGDPPPPPPRPNDPAVGPKERVVDFRGVASGKDALIHALEASQAKDMIAGAVQQAQMNFAGAGAAVNPGIVSPAGMVSPDTVVVTTPLPTPNPERVLSRIVDAVATQMDGAEQAAAMAAAGIR